ncbi:hypothetical protein EZV62_008469 [Acer yangbiense]|uniref:NB-ARC domain-containing protein n=1 Tax=Acer yangbiense TaxID=1000413 RepID=A0A5C7IDP7_9ROSI|nr:hypothetical protein EZV62_008469 [Acer yangbiense]
MDGKGTDAVEAIMLNKSLQRITWNAKSLSNMTNLRFLNICNVDLSEDPECLSNELRFLKWHEYPSNSLPSNFRPRNLFELNLCHSRIKYLWKGKKVLYLNFIGYIIFQNLKVIELSYSHDLTETPEFLSVPNLEKLHLEGCTGLRKLHESVAFLKRLIILNLKGCSNLESFPSNVGGLKLLKIFTLQGCLKLDKIPQNLEELECLERLDLGGTAMTQIPSSIAQLRNLEYLSCLSLFLPIRYLFSTCLLLPPLSGLCCLTTLDLSGSRLSEGALPCDLGSLCFLKELNLSNNNFEILPESFREFCKKNKINVFL